MVCCDTCEEWFHFECVGITTAPAENESFECMSCAKKRRKADRKARRAKRRLENNGNEGDSSSSSSSESEDEVLFKGISKKNSKRKTISLQRSTSHHSPSINSDALRSFVPRVTTSPH